MKKLLLGALLLLSALSFSQTVNEIEVGKDVIETEKTILSKGFVLTRTDGNINSYNGKLINGTDVELRTVQTSDSKLVWKVVIEFQDITNWYSLKSEYKKYQDILIEKYGKPTKSYDFFSSPYKEGDGYELQALKLEKATLMSIFKDEFGNSILVNVVSYEYGKGYVKISYENKKASEKNMEEKASKNKKTF